jgi:hypothetical protein
MEAITFSPNLGAVVSLLRFTVAQSHQYMPLLFFAKPVL